MARSIFTRRSALVGASVAGGALLALSGTVVGQARGPAQFGTQNTYSLAPPAGQPYMWGHIPDLASGDGSIWASGGMQNAVGRVTGASQAAVRVDPVNISNTRCQETGTFDAPPSYCANHIHSITVGPDGNVYFVTIHTGLPAPTRIIEMTPGGDIVGDFPNPQSAATGNFAAVVGMTGGADGNVWYQQSQTPAGVAPDGTTPVGAVQAKIVRLTPGGEQTQFSPAAGTTIVCCSGGIAAAPDGVYFGAVTRSGKTTTASYLERMSYAGVITGQWTLPTSAGQVTSVVIGPDGNVWFVEKGGIGRVNPTSGEVSTFATSAQPGGLTVGGDGNMWFSETSTNTLGQMAPNGSVVASYTTTLPGPGALATRSDGNIYYAAAGNGSDGQVGEFTIR